MRTQGLSMHAIRVLGFLSIHVAGAAERPGVYLLPHGSIVQDALDAAGGPTTSADLDRINLATDLEDGALISIVLTWRPTSKMVSGSTSRK